MIPVLSRIPNVTREFDIQDYIPGQPIPTYIRNKATGRVMVNPLKMYVRPFTLTTEPYTVTLAANAISDPIPMTIDGKGHFEVCWASYYCDQREKFTIKLFDHESRMLLQNRELHIDNIASGGGATASIEGALAAAGTGGRQYKWPESLWIDSKAGGKTISVVFRNLSSSPQIIKFALHGLRWFHTQAPQPVADRMEQIRMLKSRTSPFFYTTETNVALLTNASGSYDLRMTDEAWTEWCKATSVSTHHYNVRIRETTTRKFFMSRIMRDDLVFGVGELPFILWESSLFEPGYKLTFDLTDIPDLQGTPNVIWITLGCRKYLMDPRDRKFLQPGKAAGRMPE
jgi:hypothetical protein